MSGARPTSSTSSLRRGGFRYPVHLEGLYTACGVVSALIIPVRGRSPCEKKWLTSFARPQSTTYRIPGIVNDVSATFVETTTRRCPGGGGSKTRICLSLGKREYSGTTCIKAKWHVFISINTNLRIQTHSHSLRYHRRCPRQRYPTLLGLLRGHYRQHLGPNLGF